MIAAYHRPQTLDEALTLMARTDVLSVLAGGGTGIYRQDREPIEIIDLQALGLNQVERRGNQTVLGATLTLQALGEMEDLPPALRSAAQRETRFNIRQVGTVAGTLIASDGRSPFAAAMLALDVHLTMISAADRSQETIAYGELLPLLKTRLDKQLITQVTLPGNVRLELDMVSRTPADWPLSGVAIARWPSGRTRITLMGPGVHPRLAMDGPQPGGEIEAVQFAFNTASDQWASAEYRQAAAMTLAERALTRLNEG